MNRQPPRDGGGGEDQGNRYSGVNDGSNSHLPPVENQRRRDPRNGKIRFVKLWVNEMCGRTATLTPAAHGAYERLLYEYLKRQAPLPDDERLLRRITGVSRRDWPDIRDELCDIFDLVDGYLVDEYAEKAIAEFRAKSTRNRGNVEQRFNVISGGLEDVDP